MGLHEKSERNLKSDNIGSRLFHAYQNNDVILRKFIHLIGIDGIDGIEIQAVLYFYAVS